MGLFDIFSGGGRNRRSLSDISDNWEKKKEAREYNARAREIIDDYINRYNDTYFNTMDYAYETQRRLEKHHDFKKQIVKKLQLNVKPVLEDFKKFDIDSKTIDINFEDMNTSKNLDISIFDVDRAFSRMNNLSFNSCFPNLDDIFRDATEEYYQAKSNYNQAKLYKSQIQSNREVFDLMTREFFKERDRLSKMAINSLDIAINCGDEEFANIVLNFLDTIYKEKYLKYNF